ncbi:hypothetical protein DERP_004525 [Dermatophagoides pteronyssinus]|uniref:Uncharacterized protein n=1 Tax=Dermatophagoides pteronyssinus TaxID=6956 RepID=A0ABQ8JP09_DERPT|nr:hypothetical protein DERP_004525 [Dermatophagoides pteronyssinus]
MGNTCASIKKSSKQSQQQQSESERKVSAESIPTISTTKTTANAQIHKDTQLVNTYQSSEIYPQNEPTNTITAPSPDPISLSPIPTASTPSPYSSSRYSSMSGGHQSYQNISPISGHIDLSQYTESIRTDSFTQLFHLRCDQTTTTSSSKEQIGVEDFYLIALSTESDEIVVWNIYQQKPVRILKSIPKPRAIRMVDQLRTVVLCNRELTLYDLNKAKLLTKLKGVMNQKMPYYGLHNSKYVVALSRNRMYVNMINLDTGDLETTFKAGEDRFLNSLLTSANGKICVCGDETQKPFPLLVWDLSNRKLLYDLRIPHHEFITRLSAISDDGHYVVSVCQECNTSATNFLIVYDLQSGTLFKKWKPEYDSVSVAISTQCGGCVINGIKNNDVLVWDLSTGNIKYTLSGHTAPPDRLDPAPKSNVFLSYNSSRQDTQLRIWSLENGNCLWTFTPDKDISCCTLTPNGMGIVYGYVGEKKLNLAIREDPDKSADDNQKTNQLYIEEMCSKIIPYGDKELDGHEIDLNS